MKKAEMIISIGITIVVIVMVVSKYFIFHTEEQVSYTFPIMMSFFIIQSIMMILKTFDLSDTEFNKTYIFWISFARLLYFMAILPFNIFVFFGYNLTGETREIFGYTDGVFNYLANITLNTLMMYSFKCRN